MIDIYDDAAASFIKNARLRHSHFSYIGWRCKSVKAHGGDGDGRAIGQWPVLMLPPSVGDTVAGRSRAVTMLAPAEMAPSPRRHSRSPLMAD